MLDQQTWEFINTFAPWLAAVGMLLAVIVSLYLARRDESIRLRISASMIQILVEGGGPEHGRRFVAINVTNVGRRLATVDQLGWRMGLFRRRYYWQRPMQNLYSASLPAKLGDGGHVVFMFPIDEFRDNLNRFVVEDMRQRFVGLKSRLMKVVVTCSTGDQFRQPIDKSLREELVKTAKSSKHEAPRDI